MDSRWMKLLCAHQCVRWVQAYMHLCIASIFFEIQGRFFQRNLCCTCKWKTRMWGKYQGVGMRIWACSAMELPQVCVTGWEMGWRFGWLASSFPNWVGLKRAALRLWEVSVDPSDVIWWPGSHFWNSVAKHVQTLMSDYISFPQKLGLKMPLERVSHFALIFPSLWTLFILFLLL